MANWLQLVSWKMTCTSLGISNVTNGILANVTSLGTSANLWHKRLRHISQGHLQIMVHKTLQLG
jgi:hypothetical protein